MVDYSHSLLFACADAHIIVKYYESAIKKNKFKASVFTKAPILCTHAVYVCMYTHAHGDVYMCVCVCVCVFMLNSFGLALRHHSSVILIFAKLVHVLNSLFLHSPHAGCIVVVYPVLRWCCYVNTY